MKTLTIRQPYAWLIVNGYKTVENRIWRTSYRGPLAIHAGLKIERDALEDVLAQCEELGEPATPAELHDMNTTGAIVGTVELVDCTLTPTDSRDLEWHNPPAWAWILQHPKPIKPVPAKGKLGLWESEL